MATIELKHPHTLEISEATARAKGLVDEFADKLKASVQWDGPSATFKGAGFSGSATVTDQALQVDVDLSLVMRPLRSKIESQLRSAVEKRFA